MPKIRNSKNLIRKILGAVKWKSSWKMVFAPHGDWESLYEESFWSASDAVSAVYAKKGGARCRRAPWVDILRVDVFCEEADVSDFADIDLWGERLRECSPLLNSGEVFFYDAPVFCWEVVYRRYSLKRETETVGYLGRVYKTDDGETIFKLAESRIPKEPLKSLKAKIEKEILSETSSDGTSKRL